MNTKIRILNKGISYFERNLLRITILIFIILGVTYFFFGSISKWDSPGHYYSAVHIKENLWPSPIGWNANYFAGFPQNQFYSPFFSWIVALLSFVIPIQVAYKIPTLIALIICPIIFLMFAKKYGLEKKRAELFTIICCLILLIPEKFYLTDGSGIGTTLYSLFEIGLIPGFIVLPLSFFYLYFVK